MAAATELPLGLEVCAVTTASGSPAYVLSYLHPHVSRRQEVVMSSLREIQVARKQ